MELLIIVINSERHLDDLLIEFDKKGIRGGTILESQGMAQVIFEHSLGSGYQSFRSMLNGGRPYNKTMFLVLESKKVEIAKECVRTVVGNLKKENVGMMFTLPVSSVEGLTK